MKGWLLTHELISKCCQFLQQFRFLIFFLFLIHKWLLLWRILRWIEEHEAEEDMEKQSSLQFVMLDLSGIYLLIYTTSSVFFRTVPFQTCHQVAS